MKRNLDHVIVSVRSLDAAAAATGSDQGDAQ